MTQARLLLIERDPLLQSLLIDIFTYAGYDVHAALHDDDLETIVVHFAPDIAVISGGTRGTFAEGWRVARQLRQTTPALPLVMLSTNGAAVAEVGQTERGRLFDAGMLKPFMLDELLAMVASCCGQARAVHAVATVAMARTD